MVLHDCVCLWLWLLPRLEKQFPGEVVEKHKELFEKGLLAKYIWLSRGNHHVFSRKHVTIWAAVGFGWPPPKKNVGIPEKSNHIPKLNLALEL